VVAGLMARLAARGLVEPGVPGQQQAVRGGALPHSKSVGLSCNPEWSRGVIRVNSPFKSFLY
jgi:hypothetical protein